MPQPSLSADQLQRVVDELRLRGINVTPEVVAQFAAARGGSVDDLVQRFASGATTGPLNAPAQQAPAAVATTGAQDTLYEPASTSRTPATGSVDDAEWARLSSALGYDAQQGYQSYVSAWRTASQMQGRSTYLRSEATAGEVSTPALSPEDWFHQQERLVFGEWAPVIDLYAAQYAMATGNEMPASIREQMSQRLASMPNEEKDQIRQQMTAMLQPQPSQYAAGQTSGTPTAAYTSWQKASTAALNALSNLPVLGNVYDTAIAAAATTFDRTQVQSIQSQFGVLGRPATQAELDQLKNADQATIQSYIDTQMVSAGPYRGYTYATVRDRGSYVQKQWEAAFGTSPSEQQTAGLLGKSDDQVQQYISDSPSNIDGMSVGRKQMVSGFLDKLLPGLFGYSASAAPHLVQQANQVLKQ